MNGQKFFQTKDIDWEEWKPGVYAKSLAKDKEISRQLDIIKIEPGVKLSAHKHPEYEWVYVLEGILEDENGKYPQGTFLINEKGSIHASFSTEGCQVLVYWTGVHDKV